MKHFIFILGILTFLLTTSFTIESTTCKVEMESCEVEAKSLSDDSSYSCTLICSINYQVCMNNANQYLSNYYGCLRRGGGGGCAPILNNYYIARHACSVAKSVCLSGC